MSDIAEGYEEAVNHLDEELGRSQFTENSERVLDAYRELREAADKMHEAFTPVVDGLDEIRDKISELLD
ncbi:hypothetical protein SEA_VANLEE_99 [Gordonia phage VanLee]|uniref:Uncharacterized protein n=1 Tax=Gordonia phage VanLee TaxID=2845816 RepID=A0A8F2IFG5_9CAUD|nr:hypothetical protein QEH49_gp099 [Gordonia phage VanLee]QWS68216.1 hypothetical protein SEA_VANLEE_99 [Gordonia phage VanLee]